jgi:hypothetical protein
MTVGDTQTMVADTKTIVAGTQTVVAGTQTVVSDTQTMVADTQTMVADIHRKVLTGQECTSSQNNSVGATSIHQHWDPDHLLDPNEVSNTEYHRGLQSYVFVASPLVNCLLPRRGTVSDATS